jgi:hypothetical protein
MLVKEESLIGVPDLRAKFVKQVESIKVSPYVYSKRQSIF